MTSNLGAHNIKKKNTMGFLNDESLDKSEYENMKNSILEEVKRNFKPEFINRVDEVIVFKKLVDSDILKIINILLNGTINKLKDRRINISLNDESKKFLINKGVDINYGARPLKRIITKELEDKISEEMLKGCIKGGDNLEVYCDGKELCFKHIS